MIRQTRISKVLHLMVVASLVLGSVPPVEAVPAARSAASQRGPVGTDSDPFDCPSVSSSTSRTDGPSAIASAAQLASAKTRVFLPFISVDKSTQALISDQGGQLRSMDGRVVITAPPGAVEAATYIRHIPEIDAIPVPGKVIFQSFSLDAWQAADQSPVYAFRSPI